MTVFNSSFQLAMSVSKLLSLVVVLSASVSSQIPRCQNDQRMIFTAQPKDIEVDCDDEVALFPCQYTGSVTRPRWLINTTIYSSISSELPEDHTYHNHILYVGNVQSKHNSTYQCQLLSNDEHLCMYESNIGRLIVKCQDALLDVVCLPHFDFKNNTLTRISTFVNQLQNASFSNSYIITYHDTLSDSKCGSANIPSSCFVDGTCRHELNVSSLSCQNITEISIIVTPTNLDMFYTSEPVSIDAVNNLVQVSFDDRSASISLRFINQPKEEEKFYLVKYGPLTNNCKNLPSHMMGHLSNANSLSLELPLLESSSICFSVEARTANRTVIVEGTHNRAPSNNTTGGTVAIITSTFLVVGLIICTGITVIYFCCRKQPSSKIIQHHEQNEILGELDDTYLSSDHQSATEDQLISIDKSTTFYKQFHVTNDCYMYEFGNEHFPGYQPEEGFGYFKIPDSDFESIPLHKKILLTKEGFPKFTTFSSVLEQKQPTEAKEWSEAYEQNRSYTKKLSPGSTFLYCARSKEITSTAFWKMYDVSEQCKESEFAEKSIPRYTADWSRYCYFEFTKAEYIKPHQRIIVLMKDGRLVTGPGVRRLVGAVGDGSKMTLPVPKLNEKWDRVFIQSRSANRELIPGTKYLFCAMMDRVRAHYSIYNIHKKCNMAEFGRKHIPGYQPERGYGYYEFTQKEFFKPHKKVILVHKNKKLFTGGGAQFVCAGDKYNMDAILRKNKISPPDLTDGKWKHIFIQSYSKERELLSGTKFLYCEYKTYK